MQTAKATIGKDLGSAISNNSLVNCLSLGRSRWCRNRGAKEDKGGLGRLVGLLPGGGLFVPAARQAGHGTHHSRVLDGSTYVRVW